jgi:hypothetical protein
LISAVSLLVGMCVDHWLGGGRTAEAPAPTQSSAVLVTARALVTPASGGRVPIAFSAPVGPMAPGDARDIPVDVADAQVLSAHRSLSLWVTGAPGNALTDGSVPADGLTVALAQCSQPWHGAVCAGRTSALLPARFVARMNRQDTRVPIGGLRALAAAPGGVAHLMLRIALEGSEVSVDGTVRGPTVQGLSTTLLFFFETP